MGVSCAAGPQVTPFLAPGWAAACVSPDLLFLGTVTSALRARALLCSVVKCVISFFSTATHFTVEESEAYGHRAVDVIVIMWR